MPGALASRDALLPQGSFRTAPRDKHKVAPTGPAEASRQWLHWRSSCGSGVYRPTWSPDNIARLFHRNLPARTPMGDTTRGCCMSRAQTEKDLQAHDSRLCQDLARIHIRGVDRRRLQCSVTVTCQVRSGFQVSGTGERKGRRRERPFLRPAHAA